MPSQLCMDPAELEGVQLVGVGSSEWSLEMSHMHSASGYGMAAMTACLWVWEAVTGPPKSHMHSPSGHGMAAMTACLWVWEAVTGPSTTSHVHSASGHSMAASFYCMQQLLQAWPRACMEDGSCGNSLASGQMNTAASASRVRQAGHNEG